MLLGWHSVSRKTNHTFYVIVLISLRTWNVPFISSVISCLDEHLKLKLVAILIYSEIQLFWIGELEPTLRQEHDFVTLAQCSNDRTRLLFFFTNSLCVVCFFLIAFSLLMQPEGEKKHLSQQILPVQLNIIINFVCLAGVANGWERDINGTIVIEMNRSQVQSIPLVSSGRNVLHASAWTWQLDNSRLLHFKK